MKTRDIEIGQVYAVKISGKLVAVRIDGCDAVHKLQRWHGINLATGRKITIKSPQRCRRKLALVAGYNDLICRCE
jgi:hypothetical protein